MFLSPLVDVFVVSWRSDLLPSVGIQPHRWGEQRGKETSMVPVSRSCLSMFSSPVDAVTALQSVYKRCVGRKALALNRLELRCIFLSPVRVVSDALLRSLLYACMNRDVFFPRSRRQSIRRDAAGRQPLRPAAQQLRRHRRARAPNTTRWSTGGSAASTSSAALPCTTTAGPSWVRSG